MRIVVLPIPVHHIFDDAAKSFAAEPSDDTLCFGVQDWTMEDIQGQRKLAKGKLIAYQSELLNADNMPFRNEEYVAKLKRFDEIWDYSEHNLDYLKQHGLTCVRYKPLLPNPVLEDMPREKDIDILHFGIWSRHRTDYLNCLVANGFKVYDVLREHGGLVYGDEMHQLVLRSKVVLGIHGYPQSSIQESFRYQYPLSNHIQVLAEKSLSNPLQLNEFDSPEDMLRQLEKLGLDRVETPSYYYEHCFFPCYQSYKEETVRNADSDRSREQLSYALRQMEKDTLMVDHLGGIDSRKGDVHTMTIKLFDALMWLVLTIKEERCFDQSERKAMLSRMKKNYDTLQKGIVREKLSSTGGILMPRLRCVLLLHGWRLFRKSIESSTCFKFEKKLIRYLS